MDKVWDQMKSGAWYDAEDVSLRQLRASCKAKLQQFNAMPESDRQQAAWSRAISRTMWSRREIHAVSSAA